MLMHKCPETGIRIPTAQIQTTFFEGEHFICPFCTITHMVPKHTLNGVDLENPDFSDIPIEMVANSLSKICRYNGHLDLKDATWSVGQHSLVIADLVERDGCSPQQIKNALGHDKEEAWTGDWVRPVKKMFAALFEPLEFRIGGAMNRAYGFGPMNESGIFWDEQILHQEARIFGAYLRPDCQDPNNLTEKQFKLIDGLIHKRMELSPSAVAKEFCTRYCDLTELARSCAFSLHP